MAEPYWVDAAWAAAVLGILFLGRRARKGSGKTGMTPIVVFAFVYGIAITLLFQPLKADKAIDNEGMNGDDGVDALRPDRLGHFGNERNTSPNIDALLDESRSSHKHFRKSLVHTPHGPPP